MTPVYWPTKEGKPFVVDKLSVALLKEETHEGVFSITELEITLDNKVSRSQCKLQHDNKYENLQLIYSLQHYVYSQRIGNKNISLDWCADHFTMWSCLC